MGKLLYNCFKKAVNIFCRLPEWIRNVQMIPGFSTRLGWERGWKSCMAKSKDRRSENVNVIELNCNVVKKVATPLPPPYLHQAPLFRFIPPFLAKISSLPKWINFCKVLPTSLFNNGGWEGWRGVPTMVYIIKVENSQPVRTYRRFLDFEITNSFPARSKHIA